MPIWSLAIAIGTPTEPVHPYANPRYADALSHAGRAVWVPEWGCPVLARPVSGGGEDAIGIYPLTSLAVDADLTGGLERLRGLGLISLALVPDPISGPSPDILADAFDLIRPFKTHLTIDPASGPYSPSRHHAERIRRGYRRCMIHTGPLRAWLPDWCRLYRELVAHRGLTGISAFPDASFDAMANEPALAAFAATVEDRIVGMTLWFAHDGVVYNHLTAVDATGYANGASFALYDTAIRHFEGQGIVNLGGGAGAGQGLGGLFDFKNGFANSSVQARLCGAVLDPVRYGSLSGAVETDFFPAYRAPSV